MEIILKYFPDLTEEQRKQFAALYDLYIDWNSKINVISRKDIENLYEHHVLHSLGIAKVIQFRPGTSVPPCPCRRREENVRFRCQPCSHASGGSDKDYQEKHFFQTAECVAKRIDLP